MEVMSAFEHSAEIFLELMEALADASTLNREERKNLKIELANLHELILKKRSEHEIFEKNIKV